MTRSPPAFVSFDFYGLIFRDFRSFRDWFFWFFVHRLEAYATLVADRDLFSFIIDDLVLLNAPPRAQLCRSRNKPTE